MKTRVARLCIAFVCLMVSVVGAWGQRISGAISGQVLDPTGAAVGDAKVVIENSERAFKTEINTGDDGSFVSPDLPPGTYKVTIQHPGFVTYATNTVIRVNQTTSVVAKLEVGSLSSTVMVESGALTVDTSSATVQGVITGDQIDRLPLNGRNFLDLASQEPGVQLSMAVRSIPQKTRWSACPLADAQVAPPAFKWTA